MSTHTPITIEMLVDLEIPQVPNFLRPMGKVSPVAIPIQDLSESALREIGQRWVEALVNKAADRRSR